MPIQLGSAAGKIILDASGAMASISQVQGGMGGLRGTFASTSATLTSVGRSLTLGLSLPLIGVGTAAAKTAGDFEGQMNVLEVAARSSRTSLDDLREAAIAVGADTELVGISASEAADAMTNFYKAGLETKDIFSDLDGYLAGTTSLNGALRAAVDLAAASELDLAAASDVVAIAMATFGLDAEDATRIADSFVQTADASVASVPELADALANVGPTAQAFGWELETVNTALGILSERGIRGSEAGTALKSMMTNLMRPTDDVVGTLRDLNVSLYNADGTMRDLPEIIADLERGLAGLTEEQRNQAIQTLAGTYGMKAMNTLLAEGAAGWLEMRAQIADGATAQETAAARTRGLNAAIEQMKGSLETLLIRVGTPLIENFLTPAITGITDLVNVASGQLDPKLAGLAITFGLVAIAAGPVLTILGAMLSPVGLIAGGVAALGAAWFTNFGGIRDIVANVWASTLGPVLGNDLPGVIENLRGLWVDLVGQFELGGLERAGTFLAGKLLGISPEEVQAQFDALATAVQPALDSLLAGIQGFGASLAPIGADFQGFIAQVQGAAPGLGILAGVIGTVLLGALQALGGALPGLGSIFADVVGTTLGLLGNLLVVLGSAVEMLYKFFTGDIEGARAAALEMVRSVGETFATLLGGALQLVGDLLATVSGAIASFGDGAARVAEPIAQLADFIHKVGDALSNLHFPDFSGFIDQLKSIDVPDWLKPGSPTPLELGLRGIAGAMQDVRGLASGQLFPSGRSQDAGGVAPGAPPLGGATPLAPQIIQLVVDGRVLAEVVSGHQGQAANQLRRMGGPGKL